MVFSTQLNMKKLAYSVISLALLLSQASWAGLGENEASILKDQSRLSSSAKSHQTDSYSNYTVHHITNGSNEVREYVSKGVVFAVAWSGYSHPDLSALLGSYWSEYSTATNATNKKGNRRYSTVKTKNIVVEKQGHMRAVSGKAYIQTLLPSGVTANEIK